MKNEALNSFKTVGNILRHPHNIQRNFFSSTEVPGAINQDKTQKNFMESSTDPADTQSTSQYHEEGVTIEPRMMEDISETIVGASTYPSDTVAPTTEATFSGKQEDYSISGTTDPSVASTTQSPSGLNTDDLESAPIRTYKTSGQFGDTPETSQIRNDGYAHDYGYASPSHRIRPTLFNQMRDNLYQNLLHTPRVFKKVFMTPIQSLMEKFGKVYVK